ncbi:hypothetical protein PLESTB_000366400 [Pleodorina starrii]|uniref:Thioredoxin domain-containing protein n=1 Tax=Pleodorina starrii TaxID=330485 RepID=A0A9W6EZ21_9CHLO|nr:hypothetical protein PLESTM_000028600 [Pleodorina starrii]GLC50322.1 hypothetical protein PLESTB_000366400 [Pleodorina starrii]GLC64296.1 hypothetical protein PLESTF_000146400 [Pleodorina starrii]
MSFITEITSEAHFKTEILDTPGTLQVIEVFQSWCGPCKAVQSTFKRLYFDLNDRPLKFYSVSAERLPMLREYVGKCIPVFLFYKDGKQLELVVGVQAPALNRFVMELSVVKAAASA